MRPNTQQLGLLRTKPQRTRLYLGIYKPTIVLAAQLNNSAVAKGDRAIAYDNVTAGSYLLVETGMTLYAGTTAGAHDRGRIRVKSIVNGQITVAENDHILWTDNLFLTVVSFFEPWGIYPRIDLVGTTPVYYKDYDIPYSDQNENMNPVVAMGPNHAGFIETGSMGVFYSSSGTFDPADNSIPTGYAWFFEGGLPTASFVAHPGPVQYIAPGHFTTRLSVTSNGGKTETGHRHVMAFKKPGEGAETPIINWGFDSIQGSRDQYGYSVGFWLREQADYAKVVEGALLVIFAEHFYGSVKGLLGGNAVDRANTLFCGYIEDESIRYNSYTSRLEFRASSITQVMDYKGTFSVALNDELTASYWYQMVNMTVDKAVVHYLKWHSTILNITDFAKTDDSRRLAFADFSRGSVFSAANDLYESALLAQMTADRQGKIWSEVDLNSMPTGTYSGIVTGSRPNRVTMELIRTDWLDEMDIRVREHPDLSYVEAGGIVYDPNAPSGTVFPYLSGAPGDAPGYEGSVDKISSLLISSQQDLDVIAGLAFANSAGRYPEITFRAAGTYSNFDIAPQEQVQISLVASDTWRQLIWNRKRFIVRSVNWSFDPAAESLIPDLTLEEETAGPPGDPIIIPVEAPYQDNDLPDWDIDFPPLIPLPGIVPPIFPQPPSGNVLYCLMESDTPLPVKLYRTRNFQATSPTWEEVSFPTGISATQSIDLFFSPASFVNIAFFFKGASNANQGWLTNNLDSPIPGWTQYWGAAQDASLGGLPNCQSAGIPPTLGYHCMVFGSADVGGFTRTVFVYGSPGSFGVVSMNADIGGGLLGRNTPILHIGGSTLLQGLDNWLARNNTLGVGSTNWSSFSKTPDRTGDTVYDGAGMVWNHKNDGRLFFDPYSWAFPIIDTRFVDITPTYNGGLYTDPHSGNGADKYLVMAGGYLYASLSGVSPVGIFVRKAPGISPWSVLSTQTALLSSLEPFIPNPLLWAAIQGALPVTKIMGSSDGGINWANKTGNLVTLRGQVIPQASILRFAYA